MTYDATINRDFLSQAGWERWGFWCPSCGVHPGYASRPEAEEAMDAHVAECGRE